MKQTRNFPSVTVTKKAQMSLESGHPWVYDTEIAKIPGEPIENGSLVDVLSEKGRFLGTGLWSEKSKIRVRVLSRNANDKFDADFFRRRVKYAWDYRKTVMGDDLDACRVIFGEADMFPGLTVDKFRDVLVTQTLSYGMDRLKPLIFPALIEVLTADGHPIRGIYERGDVHLRTVEGLDEHCGWYSDGTVTVPGNDSTVTEIEENGVKYLVDFANGQKTGFFLDQKYNRREVARLAKGKRVLDCFTHTGSFALNAALGGAQHVTAVDVSADAVEMARENVRRNGLETCMDCVCENVFDLLPRLELEGKKPYDFIILDPPAFTKSRKTVDSAFRGYKEINYRAMKLLPRGGYLATCSCSHFMEDELFRKMIVSAARDAGVQLRRIEARQQSPDHPVLIGVPETEYLKFYVYQVV